MSYCAFKFHFHFKKRQDGQMVHQLPPPTVVPGWVSFTMFCPDFQNNALEVAILTWPTNLVWSQLGDSGSTHSSKTQNLTQFVKAIKQRILIWLVELSNLGDNFELEPMHLALGIQHTFQVHLCSDGATKIKRKYCKIFRYLSRSCIWEFNTPFWFFLYL